MQKFITQCGETEVLQANNMYDKTPKTYGLIAARLCDYKTAIEFFLQALQENEEDTELLERLGLALLISKQRTGLIELFYRLLNIYVGKYGQKHLTVINTLINLSKAYGLLENYIEQKNYAEAADSIAQQLYDKHSIKLADTMIVLGSVYTTCSKYYYKWEKKFKSKLSESEDNDKKAVLLEFGIINESLREARRSRDYCITSALSLLNRAHHIIEKYYGNDLYQLANAAYELSATFFARGEYHISDGKQEGIFDFYEARDLLEQALEIYKKFYGSYHVQMTMVHYNLGEIYKYIYENFSYAQSAQTKAYQHFNSAYKICLSVLGCDHKLTELSKLQSLLMLDVKIMPASMPQLISLICQQNITASSKDTQVQVTPDYSLRNPGGSDKPWSKQISAMVESSLATEADIATHDVDDILPEAIASAAPGMQAPHAALFTAREVVSTTELCPPDDEPLSNGKGEADPLVAIKPEDIGLTDEPPSSDEEETKDEEEKNQVLCCKKCLIM